MNDRLLKKNAASSTMLISAGDLLARDLNGNGVLDVYEDPRAPIDERVEDLLSQMTLDEKVGLMFHCQVGVPSKPKLDTLVSMSSAPVSKLLVDRNLNHFNILFAPDTANIARWQNRLQRLAETTRLGIPVTLSSDPRHAAELNPGAGIKQEGFSEWPSQLGLAAIGSTKTIEQFGKIAQESSEALAFEPF